MPTAQPALNSTRSKTGLCAEGSTFWPSLKLSSIKHILTASLPFRVSVCADRIEIFMAVGLWYLYEVICFTVTKELGDQNGIDTLNFKTEHIILKVKVAKSWLTVMAIYRPPSIPTSQWKFELSRLFEVVTTFPNDVICVGDFNSNLLDPKDSGHLKDLLEVYGLKNLIKLPTRI